VSGVRLDSGEPLLEQVEAAVEGGGHALPGGVRQRFAGSEGAGQAENAVEHKAVKAVKVQEARPPRGARKARRCSDLRKRSGLPVVDVLETRGGPSSTVLRSLIR
jgi:hypothetical protein